MLCGSMRNYALMADLVGILSRAGIEAIAPEPDVDTPPKPGTALTTSGAQLSAFPDSIPVGKVRTVRETDGGLTYELVVRPMADTERMQFATVLLWEPPE